MVNTISLKNIPANEVGTVNTLLKQINYPVENFTFNTLDKADNEKLDVKDFKKALGSFLPKVNGIINFQSLILKYTDLSFLIRQSFGCKQLILKYLTVSGTKNFTLKLHRHKYLIEELTFEGCFKSPDDDTNASLTVFKQLIKGAVTGGLTRNLKKLTLIDCSITSTDLESITKKNNIQNLVVLVHKHSQT